MTTEVVSLEEAVRAAVEQGHTELTRLDELTAELVEVFTYGQRDTGTSSDLISRVDKFAREFPEELRCHLDRERSSLGSFNIAFFGRTGVGKSTLLSAFGRLDGEYVSPGASDWTTDVQRYWSTAVAETLDELRSQLTDYVARAEVAASGVARRDAWERELDVLDRAAQASLGGLVDEVFRRSWDRTGSGTSGLQQDVQRALDDWFAKHDVRLQRLAQSIRKTRERERARPSWDGFAALVSTLGRGPEDTQMVTKSDGVAGHVDTVGKMLINLLKATNGKSGSGGKGKSSPVKGAGEAVRYIGVAEAALPLAVYAAQFVDKQMADRARAAQDKDAIDQRQQIIAECTLRAREAWQPFVDEVRATIIEETSDQVDLDESLRRLVDQLEAAVAEGARLLSDAGTVSLGVRT
ncbi:P-loop NTPase family protein [Prescottella equi]|uniref:hypothetical protein n=1 Tax=Rhodococcus hoagii TaxID=43767 RepID=UPI000ABAA5E5|nr:hypothetical protein [Prescottella equi]UNQ32971.1 hypothetical protein MPC39_12485 [Prescottella equi]